MISLILYPFILLCRIAPIKNRIISVLFWTILLISGAIFKELFTYAFFSILLCLITILKCRKRVLRKVRTSTQWKRRRKKTHLNLVSSFNTFSPIKIPLQLNGRTFCGELDSGSALNILPLKKFELVKNSLSYKNISENKEFVLMDCQNKQIKVYFVIKTAIFVPNCGSKNLRFFVCETDTLLLGREFMKSTNLNFNVKGNFYEITYSNSKNANFICNLEPFALRPHQVKYIRMKANKVFNSNFIVIDNKELHTQPFILNKEGNNSTFIKIQNATNNDLSFQEKKCNLSIIPIVGINRWPNVEVRRHPDSDYLKQKMKLSKINLIVNQESSDERSNLDLKNQSECRNLYDEKEIDENKFRDSFSIKTGGIEMIDNSHILPMTKAEICAELQAPESFKHAIATVIEKLQVCSLAELDCGTTRETIKMEIKEGCTIPRNCKPYRQTIEESAQIEAFMQFLCFHKLAKVSDNENQWGSSVFLIPRKGKDRPPRLLIDFRAVNSVLKGNSQNYTCDPLYAILAMTPSVKFITTIDIKNCYYSFPLSMETIESGIGNIITERNAYTLLRGITGAAPLPAWLQSYTNKYLNLDSQGTYSPLGAVLIKWFDDLILASHEAVSLEDHLNEVYILLERLKNLGFKISLPKCQFGIDSDSQSLEILGYEIAEKSLKIPQKKLKGLINVKCPKTLKELQVFLGSCNYFRNILDLNIHSHLSVLYKNTGKIQDYEKIKFHFDCIIKRLEEVNQQITPAGSNEIYILVTDGAIGAIGSVLLSYDVSEFLESINIEGFSRVETNDPVNSYFKDNVCNVRVLSSNHDLIECIYQCLLSLQVIKKQDKKDFLYCLISQAGFQLDFCNFIHNEHDVPKHILFKEFKKEIAQKYLRANNIEFNNIEINYLLLCVVWIMQRQLIVLLGKEDLLHGTLVGKPEKNRADIIFYRNQKGLYTFYGIVKEFEMFPKTKMMLNEDLLDNDKVVKNFYKSLKGNCKSRIKIQGFYSKSLPENIYKKSGISYIVQAKPSRGKLS